MRAKPSLTNTHYCTIGGAIIIRDKNANAPLTVRFTSDGHGETISIADDRQGLMFVVPFKEVDKIIKEARAERNRGAN